MIDIIKEKIKELGLSKQIIIGAGIIYIFISIFVFYLIWFKPEKINYITYAPSTESGAIDSIVSKYINSFLFDLKNSNIEKIYNMQTTKAKEKMNQEYLKDYLKNYQGSLTVSNKNYVKQGNSILYSCYLSNGKNNLKVNFYEEVPYNYTIFFGEEILLNNTNIIGENEYYTYNILEHNFEDSISYDIILVAKNDIEIFKDTFKLTDTKGNYFSLFKLEYNNEEIESLKIKQNEVITLSCTFDIKFENQDNAKNMIIKINNDNDTIEEIVLK